MAAHPLLNQVRSKSEILVVNGKSFNVVLSYNKVHGIDGYVVGLKFSDASGSMDSSKSSALDAHQLSIAVSRKAVQMLKPELDSVEILGYFLLTDDIEVRKMGGSVGKKRVYSNGAIRMRRELKDRLQHLANLEVDGGAAWILSVKPYSDYEQFHLLENELAKQLRIEIC
jgi:hypothetical protein